MIKLWLLYSGLFLPHVVIFARFTCKLFHPDLNSPKQSCAIILDIGIRPLLTLPANNTGKRGKNKMRANIFPACIQYLFDYNIISTIKWCIFTKPWGSIFRNKGPDPLKDINATFRLPSASMSSCKRKLWLIHNRTYE